MGRSGCATDTSSHTTSPCQEQCPAFSQPAPNAWALKPAGKAPSVSQTSSKGANYTEFWKGIGQDGGTAEPWLGAQVVVPHTKRLQLQSLVEACTRGN